MVLYLSRRTLAEVICFGLGEGMPLTESGRFRILDSRLGTVLDGLVSLGGTIVASLEIELRNDRVDFFRVIIGPAVAGFDVCNDPFCGLDSMMALRTCS